MYPQIVFEDLTAVANRIEKLASALAVAIISSQIPERLLAFKNGRRSELFR